MRVVALLVAVIACSALAQPGSVFPSKDEKEMARLLEPQNVSSEVKSFLKSKMKSHNKDMRDLVLAIATLRYEDSKKFAQGIAVAPRLDKAAGASVELPPAYFTLQDALRKQAEAISAACDAKNPEDLAATFSTMMRTCVSCHNAFLVPQRDKPEKGKKKDAK
ncbi:MAG: cytochrome c [Myxococcaceae bacterium]|nr:cytochrome c [Myxococcaceae bacterium]